MLLETLPELLWEEPPLTWLLRALLVEELLEEEERLTWGAVLLETLLELLETLPELLETLPELLDMLPELLDTLPELLETLPELLEEELGEELLVFIEVVPLEPPEERLA